MFSAEKYCSSIVAVVSAKAKKPDRQQKRRSKTRRAFIANRSNGIDCLTGTGKQRVTMDQNMRINVIKKALKLLDRDRSEFLRVRSEATDRQILIRSPHMKPV